jgi:hypothetical protein
LGRRKWIRKSRTGKYGLEKIFEDLNLIEGNDNGIGLAVRENK